MNAYKKFSLSFAFALTLHATILALFGVSFGNDTELVKQEPMPEIIQASILDETKIQQEAQRLKQKENQKQLTQQRQQQQLKERLKKEQELLRNTEQRRQQEEKKTLVLEQQRKTLALKEKQRKKAQERQQALALKKRKQAEQEAKQRQQAAAAKNKALLAKQALAAKARAKANKHATIAAQTAIQQKVIKRWIKPPLFTEGMSCTIRVRLLSSGDVMSVTVLRSSGNSIFDRSAENAVRKASPLPVPKDKDLFTKKFRLFTFLFKPKT